MFATISKPTRLGIKHIVAATDFSRLSDRALDYAFSFARRYDSTVFATHVISPSLYATPSAAALYGGMDPLPYLDNVRRELTHRLEEVAVNAQDVIVAITGMDEALDTAIDPGAAGDLPARQLFPQVAVVAQHVVVAVAANGKALDIAIDPGAAVVLPTR